jgi:hypothetical protein
MQVRKTAQATRPICSGEFCPKGLPFLQPVIYINEEIQGTRLSSSDLSKLTREGKQMKAIKTSGLAVLAALMAMAFVGAGPASAEALQLCGHDAPEGLSCEAIHHIHLVSVGKAKLLTSIGTTECEELFLGNVVSWGPPIIISGTFTLVECKLGSTSCTETEENGPSELEVLKTGVETAEVTGELLVHLNCGGLLNCTYNGVGLTGTGKGALTSTQENGEITFSEAVLNKEVGVLCPKTAKLDITLKPLWPIYIAPRLLGYCVTTEHTVGIYTDSLCETLGKTGGHEYQYTLVFAPEGYKVGQVLCYGTLLKFGLYKGKESFNECEKDIPIDEPRIGLYERGTIVTVE